ncbi:MAG: hypothetical protein ACRD6I_18830, partial [Candidatus Acidiferrales bacterium]
MRFAAEPPVRAGGAVREKGQSGSSAKTALDHCHNSQAVDPKGFCCRGKLLKMSRMATQVSEGVTQGAGKDRRRDPYRPRRTGLQAEVGKTGNSAKRGPLLIAIIAGQAFEQECFSRDENTRGLPKMAPQAAARIGAGSMATAVTRAARAVPAIGRLLCRQSGPPRFGAPGVAGARLRAGMLDSMA